MSCCNTNQYIDNSNQCKGGCDKCNKHCMPYCNGKDNNYNSNQCKGGCTQCNKYCMPCYPIDSPLTKYYSQKYHNLENNYPVHKCKCNNFGINPRYYNKPHKPCNCRDKCYPC